MDRKPVSYYDILGLRPHASDEDIRQAYRRLAFRFHPDRNPQGRSVAELRFRLISEAYAHLKTPEKRALYNRSYHATNDNQSRPTSWLRDLMGLFVAVPAGERRDG
ncbi:MAG: DnaJ domain-containing protein [Alphaproteobacteria bacterium]|nr:DnaJ domain-containing protein [Alphaproteobacteria bacterium]